jgi:hypothetical protein
MAVTMKNAVFWDVTPRGSCKNQCSLRSFEMSVLTRGTWRSTSEDGILRLQLFHQLLDELPPQFFFPPEVLKILTNQKLYTYKSCMQFGLNFPGVDVIIIL